MPPQASATAAVATRRIVSLFSRAGGLLHHVGKQTEKARPLDRPRQLALLLGRYRGDAARHDLAALRDKALQQSHVLIIDLWRIWARERAGFAPAKKWPARRCGRAVSAAGRTRPRPGLAFHLGLHLFDRFGRRNGRSGRLDRRALAAAVAAFAIAVAVAAARPVL